MDFKSIIDCEREAQMQTLDWKSIFTGREECIFKAINPRAEAIFVPFEFLFFPLAAACGGLAQHSQIKLKGKLFFLITFGYLLDEFHVKLL